MENTTFAPIHQLPLDDLSFQQPEPATVFQSVPLTEESVSKLPGPSNQHDGSRISTSRGASKASSAELESTESSTEEYINTPSSAEALTPLSELDAEEGESPGGPDETIPCDFVGCNHVSYKRFEQRYVFVRLACHTF
jgi:hypothetical protein